MDFGQNLLIIGLLFLFHSLLILYNLECKKIASSETITRTRNDHLIIRENKLMFDAKFR